MLQLIFLKVFLVGSTIFYAFPFPHSSPGRCWCLLQPLSKHSTKTHQLKATFLSAQRCQNPNRICHLVKKEEDLVLLHSLDAASGHSSCLVTERSRRRWDLRRKNWVENPRKSFCFRWTALKLKAVGFLLKYCLGSGETWICQWRNWRRMLFQCSLSLSIHFHPTSW